MSYESTAPPAPNTLGTVTPSGGSGVPGGRSLPAHGRNGSIRCQGDNLNSRLPNGLGATLTGSAGAIVGDNPPVPNEGNSTQLSYDSVPPVGMTAVGDNSGANVANGQLSMDSDGAANPSKSPGRLS
jgi:hypothetical protein